MWNYVDSSNPRLENSLFGAVKLVKETDIDKYMYSGFGIWFDMKGAFSVGNRFGNNVMDLVKMDRLVGNGFDKNAIIFGVDMKSSVHVDNKKKKFNS